MALLWSITLFTHNQLKLELWLGKIINFARELDVGLES
jgi:hypothetical protein